MRTGLSRWSRDGVGRDEAIGARHGRGVSRSSRVPRSGERVDVTVELVLGREGDVRFEDPQASRRHVVVRTTSSGSRSRIWIDERYVRERYRVSERTLASSGDVLRSVHLHAGRRSARARERPGRAVSAPRSTVEDVFSAAVGGTPSMSRRDRSPLAGGGGAVLAIAVTWPRRRGRAVLRRPLTIGPSG